MHPSINFHQKKLSARIMDQLEADGIVSAANHVGKREILGPPGGE